MIGKKGIVLRHPLAYNQVRLGDMTLNIDTPWNDFRSYPFDLAETDVFRSDKLTVSDIDIHRATGSVSATVAGLFEAIATASKFSFTMQSTSTARCYRLNNSGDKFEASCAHDATRQWLQKQMIERDCPGYMIVGIYTFQDAKVTEGRANTLELATDVKPDAAAAAAAMGITAGAGGKVVIDNLQARVYVSPDEQIFALEYRAIKFNWFVRKRITEAQLSKSNYWQIFWGIRSSRESGSDDVEDVVEAVLDDEEADDIDPKRGFDIE
jgi:hypothetical protein